MAYYGDLTLGDTIDVKFSTISQGVPFTLAGSPVISAYLGNSTTELTAGITLTVDFDGRTGLNNVRVVASNGNGYAVATNYVLVITTGTVNGISAVGYVIGSFSIQNRLALLSTGSGTGQLDFTSGVVKSNATQWLGGTIPAVNVTGVPKVDVLDWLGSTPDALSSGKIPADLKLWLATAPLALSSQQVQAIVSAYASGQAPLQPTVAGRTLDVSATGEGGVDWGNVGSPTTTNGLTGTTISTTQTVATVTDLTAAQAEPGQAAPAANASVVTKIAYLYKAWRNRTTQTATAYKLFNDDAATVDQKATFSDDTVTADRSEIGSGP